MLSLVIFVNNWCYLHLDKPTSITSKQCGPKWPGLKAVLLYALGLRFGKPNFPNARKIAALGKNAQCNKEKNSHVFLTLANFLASFSRFNTIKNVSERTRKRENVMKNYPKRK